MMTQMKSEPGALHFAGAVRESFKSTFGFQNRRLRWIPEPPPPRDFELEKRQREFLATWGPPVKPDAGDATLPNFEAQCQAMSALSPKVISSIMGLYSPAFVSEMKARGILWFANATTVAEAKAAEQAGADAIVAQGMEAAGHRGAFHPSQAERQMVGLMALLPQLLMPSPIWQSARPDRRERSCPYGYECLTVAVPSVSCRALTCIRGR